MFHKHILLTIDFCHTGNKAKQQNIMLNQINSLPKHQILDSSKLKEVANNNFRFDENGRNFSKWIENTVGKGEIACYEQFLLSPQCFQKT